MPRGRPKGSKNKSTLIKEGKLDPETLQPIRPVDTRTDDEILADTVERFDVYRRMMEGVVNGDVTALIVSGASGTGKSYTAYEVLEKAQERDNTFRYTMKSGTVTPIELYKLAYQYRHPGNVIILDDADGVMGNEDGLNVLKGLLDTGTRRRVSWLSNSSALKEDGEETPKEYGYSGSIGFLTNKDFQGIIDGEIGRSNVEHMKALMSRAHYLDLKMQSRREVTIWVKNIVLRNHILYRKGLPKDLELEAVKWLVGNMENLREISIRTALKLGQIMMINPNKWEQDARHLLVK